MNTQKKAAYDYLSKIKPNAAQAKIIIKALAAAGYHVADVRAALEDYHDINRSDYDDAEDYVDARADAWASILDAIDAIEEDKEI